MARALLPQSLAPRVRATLAALAVLALSSGCGDQQLQAVATPFPFKIEVKVVDPAGLGVPRAPVLIDGKTVGYTDRNGDFIGSLNELPGTPLEVSVGDPEGHRVLGERSRQETLRLNDGIDGTPQPLPISLNAKAESILSDYLVWVHVKCDESFAIPNPCAAIPVQIDGKVSAYTDAFGIAAATVRGRDSQKVAIIVDTPPAAAGDEFATRYEPMRPEYQVDLNFGTGVLLIEETLRDANAELRKTDKRRPQGRTAAPTRAPSNAGQRPAPSKPKPAPEKKKGPPIIDIW